MTAYEFTLFSLAFVFSWVISSALMAQFILWAEHRFGPTCLIDFLEWIWRYRPGAKHG